MSRGTADEHRADEDRTARTGARSNTEGARSSHRGTSGAGAMLAYDDFAVTNDPVIGIPGRPSPRAAIRRRKVVWLVAAVVGLALGIGLFKVMPPPYKATASVYITAIPGVLPTDQILTEVALAQSRTVAEQAMHTLRLPEDPKSVQTFMGRDTVLAPTDQIITFTVKASSAADAGARAGALASAYLHVRDDRLGVSLQRTMTALNSQIATEKSHLTALAAKIATVQAEPASIKQQNQLASLKAEQPQAEAALKALKAAAKHFGASTHVSNTTVIKGSRVLDQGQAAPRSKIKYPVLYAVGGLLAGLAIGMGWVIVSALVSTRPRRRYDIARALGAPVRLSVGRIRVSRRSAQRAPESAGGRGVQQIARYLRGAVPQEQGRASLAVVAADDTVVPALAIVSLALSCVREGTRVILADLTSGSDAGRLLGCTEPGVHRHVAGQRQLTVAVPEDGSAPQIGPIRRGSSASVPQSVDPEVDHAYHAAELLLTLASIDPGLGADHLRSWASEAVVILTAGKPSATRVRTVSELIRLSGITLTSAVVVGADRTDESLGLLTPRDDEDMQARPPGPAAERVRRDVRLPQPNGSQARGHAGPEQEQGERAQARPESRPERRPEHRPEPRSEQRSEALQAESRTEVMHEARSEPRTESRREPRPEPRPDGRHEPRTQPRRAVDLRKDSSPGPEPTSGSEDTTRPERARPAHAPGPETMPYADADSRESTVSGEPSGAWRG
jgi:capsular polysaccharide biosynthesis protein